MHRLSDLRSRLAGVLPLGLALLGSALFFPACVPSEPAEGALLRTDGTPVYADGTFVASESHTAPDGFQAFLQLTVRAGLIADVFVDAVDTGEMRVRESDLRQEYFRLETVLSLPDMLDSLQLSLIDRQALPVPVPAAPGGTAGAWSSRFLVLAQAALAAAAAGSESGHGDDGVTVVPVPGVYETSDDPDELGWRAHLAVVFDDESIVAAGFEERRLNADGSWSVKAEDTDYAGRYESLIGLTPVTVAEELSRQLVSADTGSSVSQYPQIDGVSGATGTSNRFRSLLSVIISQRTAVPLPHRLDNR